MSLLLIEFAFAIVLVVVACWVKRYWLGSSPSADRDRCAAEYRAKNGVDPLGPSPLGALFFAFLALLTLLRMFSGWVTVDLAEGQLTVEQRTWWGLAAKHQQWRADEVAKVDVAERAWRSPRGSASYFHSLVFKRADGVVLYKTSGDILAAKDRAALLMKELRKGNAGCFHDWAFQHVGPCLPFLFAFLVMTMILGRNGLLPSRKSRPQRMSVSKNGISLGNMLSRPGQ